MVKKQPKPPTLPLADLLESWLLALRAENKSAQTLRSYEAGVRRFLAFCDREGIVAALDKSTLNRFVADMLDTGLADSTAVSRQLAVRRFSAWLAEEEEIEHDYLAGAKPPKLGVKVMPTLSDEELVDLLRACKGNDLMARRDEALVRLMAESGCRIGEALGMTLVDVNIRAQTVVLRKGKGGKQRTVSYGPSTARALDRYLRARRGHTLADTPLFWLGTNGRGFKYEAAWAALNRRAEAAGIGRERLHPHMLRRTAASRWLAAGGSEGGLMAMAGWSSRDMLDRYVRATAESRSHDEARRLRLGEIA